MREGEFDRKTKFIENAAIDLFIDTAFQINFVFRGQAKKGLNSLF